MTDNDLAAKVRALDYRMVEWWAPDGKSYSLAQVVKWTDVLAILRADAPAASEPSPKPEGLDVALLEEALLLHAGEFIAEPESFGTRRLVAENLAAIYARLRGGKE